jgi:hypothetical protein
VAHISTRVEKKTKQKNTNIKKVKEKKEKKKKKKKKKNNKNKKPYIQNQNKKCKNKVLLITTHNKEKYNTNAQNNIKSTIHHISPNQIKKSSTNSCIHRNTQKTILSNILKINHGPKKSISQTHPRMYQNKQKTHCYNNITQLQIHLDKNITHLSTKKKPQKTLIYKPHRLNKYKKKGKFAKKIHYCCPTNYTSKIQNTITAKNYISNKQTPNKSTHLLLLICGDIERNPGPKLNLLLNHPQIHQEKHNTYFYKNTTQIKIEYEHIYVTFKPYLNHTHTENTNLHLKQFCINHQQCPHNHLFYAILITLASTPTQCNQLISKNSTQWTLTVLNKIINSPTLISIEPHALIKFHSENPGISKPLASIQKEIYSFITTKCPNEETLLQKFPYLPKNLAHETLKCLHPLPNFTNPNPIQNHPILQAHNIPYTNPATNILSWNVAH